MTGYRPDANRSPGRAARLDAAAAVGAFLQRDSNALREVLARSAQPQELAHCLAAMAATVMLAAWPEETRSSFLTGWTSGASAREDDAA